MPVPLLGVATWATPTLAPLARMALTTALRRALAESVCRYWRRAPRAQVPCWSPPGGGDDDDGDDGGDGDGGAGGAPLRVVARLPVVGAASSAGAAGVASALWGAV